MGPYVGRPPFSLLSGPLPDDVPPNGLSSILLSVEDLPGNQRDLAGAPDAGYPLRAAIFEMADVAPVLSSNHVDVAMPYPTSDDLFCLICGDKVLTFWAIGREAESEVEALRLPP
jgi:hypothetical protein